jgi:hypothetical protein
MQEKGVGQLRASFIVHFSWCRNLSSIVWTQGCAMWDRLRSGFGPRIADEAKKVSKLIFLVSKE